MDTLILHDMNGKDYFISLEASFYNTCFGQPFDTLVRLTGPIREKSLDNNQKRSLDRDAVSTAPVELTRLIEWLMTNGLEEDDLFLRSGDDDVISHIRECLDTRESFDSLTAHERVGDTQNLALAFASTLVELLDSTPDPLVPPDVAIKCAAVSDKEEAFEVLTALPTHQLNAFISVAAFLHFLSGRISKHGVDRRRKLANVFAPLLLRDATRSTAEYPPSQVGLTFLEKRRFLLLFMS